MSGSLSKSWFETRYLYLVLQKKNQTYHVRRRSHFVDALVKYCFVATFLWCFFLTNLDLIPTSKNFTHFSFKTQIINMTIMTLRMKNHLNKHATIMTTLSRSRSTRQHRNAPFLIISLQKPNIYFTACYWVQLLCMTKKHLMVS